ncbi:MAG: hypothetical protein WBY94_26220 [Polyangiaceae bacterium]|jgi:hypothetical protein
MDRQPRLHALTVRISAIAGIACVAESTACGRHARGVAESVDASSVVSPSAIRMNPVFVANHGKLVGAFNGFAWVAGSEGTRVDAPNPCDEHGCFRGNDGALCARGTIPARSCSDALPSACGEGAWGVKIGLDVRREGGPWGRSASSYVAVEYRGAKRVRLAAHRAGDESDREYCVDGYASGAIVGAARFGIECWRGGGDVLASFEEIDKFTVELAASDEASMFNYCVTAIRVGNAIDAAVGPADVPATRVPSAHK